MAYTNSPGSDNLPVKERRPMADEYDVNEPILILVRRGRGDRGYLVAAVDDASNPLPCPDEGEVGKAVLELLNDPKQPRFDERQLEEAYRSVAAEEGVEEEEEEAAEEEGEEEPAAEAGDDPFAGLDLDPGDKLLFQIGSAIIGKARHLSNDYRRPRKKKGSKRT